MTRVEVLKKDMKQYKYTNLTCSVALRILLSITFASVLSRELAAQTFSNIHSFSGGTNGAGPWGPLVGSGEMLYGTANSVFTLNAGGIGFTTLHSLLAPPGSPPWTNNDGVSPYGQLVLSGNRLFGTAANGGSFGGGTAFSVNTDGTDFTVLYRFTGGADGASPQGSLVLSGNTLYGTASLGGASGSGTVFALNTDGTGFTNLYSFTALGAPYPANTDGANPYAGLILRGSRLFGTAANGGSSAYGTVFSINTDGSAFTTLHNFAKTDGNGPSAALILSGDILYGTTVYGGSYGSGTVFSLNTNSSGFVTLHHFTARSAFSPYANIDGTNPWGALILVGDRLYGTAINGGISGRGTVFSLNIDGTGFVTLHSFSAASAPSYTNSDGYFPYAGLISWSNALYGTTSGGGSSNAGTVFSISLPMAPPQLTIAPSHANFVLTWPTNATGFTLQSTTNLASHVWTSNSPAPIVVNGQNTVTNPISGTQQFFRLSQ
jgi:uncharacterized repeat protein (TIGR03803 family)